MSNIERIYKMGYEPIPLSVANEDGEYEIGDRFATVENRRVKRYEVVSDEEWEAL